MLCAKRGNKEEGERKGKEKRNVSMKCAGKEGKVWEDWGMLASSLASLIIIQRSTVAAAAAAAAVPFRGLALA